MFPERTRESGAAAPSLEYRVSARALRGGEAEVTVAKTLILLDAGWAPPPIGAPGPADLLGGAFAACLLKNLARTGALLDFTYDDAHADVVLRRKDSPPKFVSVQYDLRVTTDELAAVCDVHGTVTVIAPTPDG